MRSRSALGFGWLALCYSIPVVSFGQTALSNPDSSASPFPPGSSSLGQPALYNVRWGPLLGYNLSRERPTTRLFVNVSRQLIGPKLGGFEGSLEGRSEPELEAFYSGNFVDLMGPGALG